MKNFKTDFKKWLFNGGAKPFINHYAFEDLPKSMQWGVKVDFFDSVGIYIEVIIIPSNPAKYMYRVWHNDKSSTRDYETRPEAREKALEKAIEIYEQLEPKPT